MGCLVRRYEKEILFYLDLLNDLGAWFKETKFCSISKAIRKQE